MANSKTWLGFYGAAGTVTGSRTVLTHLGARYLIDCGLFQGTTDERMRNWQPFPFDQTSLNAVIVTHAHLDHSGALPLLITRGYKGPIYCTEGTAELLPILLRDSGRLQEEEAGYRNKRKWSKHDPALPLYTEADAERTLKFLRPVAYGKTVRETGIEFTFHPAVHIIGSAHVHVALEGGPTVLFSGDIGRGNHLFFSGMPPRPAADTIVCESTYGDRRHPEIDPKAELEAAVRPVLERGGVALIPAFAVGKAQEILASLELSFEEDQLTRCPVFLDSPMASQTLAITTAGQDEISTEGSRRLESAAKHTKIIADAMRSKDLNDLQGPAIIVSASGMLTGGRILHHVISRASHKLDALILCGYQARGTRGRRLADGERSIKIFGQLTDIEMEVISLASFSAHADQEGLLRWLASGSEPARVIANHGEPSAISAFVAAARARFENRFPIVAAQSGERYSLEALGPAHT